MKKARLTRLLSLVLSLLLLFSLALPALAEETAGEDSTYEDRFVDKNLLAYVRKLRNVPEDKKLTLANLQAIGTLDLGDLEITSLEGLQGSGIRSLTIRTSPALDDDGALAVLKTLPITHAVINGTAISTFPSFLNDGAVSSLDLTGNKISSL